MLSRGDLLNSKNIYRGLLNSKEKAIKKKNSEIESRLFKKTQYYVIAVGNKSSASGSVSKIRSYIYYNGYICFYNTQGRAYNKQEYSKYIEFVKQAVDADRYEWTDFWINKGQIITKDKSNNIYVDSELIKPFTSITRLAGNVNEPSLKLFYEFLKSVNKDDENKLSALETTYTNGALQDKVKKIVKNMSAKQLDNIDKEIIVRTKIEGYSYIESYVKSVLSTNKNDKHEIVNGFFSRLFFLEMYGYLSDEEE